MTRERLILGCADLDALPLFSRIDDAGRRDGYEPAAAALVAAELGVGWSGRVLAWADFYPALADGRVDAVWCGQGITDARRELADFSRPYAIFDESLVVRADNPGGVARRARAASASARSTAAPTSLWPRRSPGEVVGLPGVRGRVRRHDPRVAGRGDRRLRRRRRGDGAAGRRARSAASFTVATQIAWGVAVRRGDDELRIGARRRAGRVIADGRPAGRVVAVDALARVSADA